MARTRTQTGVIKDKKYDYPTLRVKGEKTLSSDKPEKKIRKGGKPNKKNPKKTPNKGTGKGKEKETSSNRSLSPLSDFNHEPTPQPEAGGRDTSDGNHFWPSVVLGAKEQKGLR